MINLDVNYITNGLIGANDTIYFTVTNNGYLDYTLNMLKSLNRYNIDKKVLVVCLDSISNDYFKSIGYFTHFIDLNLNEFSEFGTDGFAKCCYIKIFLIYKFLQMGYNVFYSDGDIFYTKNPLDEINMLNEECGDMWIQNDTMDDNNINWVCAGFMYIRSNSNTLKHFNIEIPEFAERYNQFTKHTCDQHYLNIYIRPFLDVKVFPLNKFPNGNYFYNFSDKIRESITMVHFNWIVGHEKRDRMKKYNMWLV
jgi:hypothetical protein